MATAQEPPVPHDLSRVTLADPIAAQYWSNRFDVAPDRLARAVEATDGGVDAVRAWLDEHG
jgi:hypothetical protein